MKNVLTLLLLSVLAGCASGQKIIIDRQGVDMAQYQHDLAECNSYASEAPDAGNEALRGAAGGAVVGGVVGAIVDNSRTASRAAGVGAVAGGLRGAGKAKDEQDRVVKNCLRGRGYRVLN